MEVIEQYFVGDQPVFTLIVNTCNYLSLSRSQYENPKRALTLPHSTVSAPEELS